MTVDRTTQVMVFEQGTTNRDWRRNAFDTTGKNVHVPRSLEQDVSSVDSSALELQLMARFNAPTIELFAAATHWAMLRSDANVEARTDGATWETRLISWNTQIAAADGHQEIIAVLRMFGLYDVADRLVYLYSLADDDPDEPRIEIESARAMALFLMGERQLPDPQIGVNPDGLIQIEWRVPTNGIVAMEFLPSGLIRFAAISAPARAGVERECVSGTLPIDATLDAVRPFTSRLSLR